ncbi:MAG: T9SS type A sorting domain-containing protein, partial [Syntrophothermus sp.]
EVKPAGKYEVSWDAANYSSGMYLYQIKAGNYTDTKKMLLMK